MDEIIIPPWLIITIIYFIIGIVLGIISYMEDFGTYSGTDWIPFWPLVLMFWLPMLIFTPPIMLIKAMLKTDRVTITKIKFRNWISQVKYRREVKKHKPKYGYNK